MSSLKASEELKLRRGVLHTDAVRHAVGGSSLRLATWAALGCPPHHVIVITWYDGPTPSFSEFGEGRVGEKLTGHLVQVAFTNGNVEYIIQCVYVVK